MTLAEAVLQAADNLENNLARAPTFIALHDFVKNHLCMIRMMSELPRRLELQDDANRKCAQCGKADGRRGRKRAG